MAVENLRRFFEQQFNENNDSWVTSAVYHIVDPPGHRGLRQHALLNLVRMHYMHQEYDACHKVGSRFALRYSEASDVATFRGYNGL